MKRGLSRVSPTTRAVLYDCTAVVTFGPRKGEKCRHPGIHRDGKCWYHSEFKEVDRVCPRGFTHRRPDKSLRCEAVAGKTGERCRFHATHEDGRCWKHTAHTEVRVYVRRQRRPRDRRPPPGAMPNISEFMRRPCKPQGPAVV
jgi:hypothetical protein